MDDQADQSQQSITKPQLGRALRRLRKAVDLNQVEVAKRARETGSLLTSGQISKWENGRDWPMLRSLFDFLAAMGCDLGDLQLALDGGAAGELAEPGTAASFKGSPKLRAVVAEIIGESEEIAGLRNRIRDLERRLAERDDPRPASRREGSLRDVEEIQADIRKAAGQQRDPDHDASHPRAASAPDLLL